MSGFKLDTSDLDHTEASIEAFSNAVSHGGLDDLYTALADTLAGRVQAVIPRLSGAAARGVQAVDGTVQYREVYTPWLDFGGSTKVGGGDRVFRQVVRGGRYLFPQLSKLRNEGMDMAEKALAALAEKNGLEVD